MKESMSEARLDICEEKLRKKYGGGDKNEREFFESDLNNFKQACFDYAIEEHIKKLWMERNQRGRF